MSWREKREQVTGDINQLASQNLNALSVEDLETVKQKYEGIQRSLTRYLTDQAQTYQLSSKLEKTGTLQGQIQRLHEENDKMKTDLDTALARDELLRSREHTGNEHTLYLLDRPVRRGMIPYLWVLSVLFVGLGVLCFYWMAPTLLPSTPSVYGQPTILDMILHIFSDRLVWMSLFAAACIVILFLSLKIAGVFGK